MTALNVEGLNVTEADMSELLTVHDHEWRAEVPRIREHFAEFGDDLPQGLHDEVDRLEANLAR
jgi:phosphoenolpyruvate carboxykinase (GTP)